MQVHWSDKNVRDQICQGIKPNVSTTKTQFNLKQL